MKQSSLLWLTSFSLFSVYQLVLLWTDTPFSQDVFPLREFDCESLCSVHFPFTVIFTTYLFLIAILIGYYLKKTIWEDLVFINDQYYLTNKSSCGIKAVKIETCNLERKYYVYGDKCEAPTTLSYYSEGFIRSIWSCTKTPGGQLSIAMSLFLLSIYCFMSNFGDVTLSFLQFAGVSYALACFFSFMRFTLVKKYTISNISKKNEHLLNYNYNYNNLSWRELKKRLRWSELKKRLRWRELKKRLRWSELKKRLRWSELKKRLRWVGLKKNLCYIIKKDSLDKYEEKFNIRNNSFYIVDDNGDYVFYYRINE